MYEMQNKYFYFQIMDLQRSRCVSPDNSKTFLGNTKRKAVSSDDKSGGKLNCPHGMVILSMFMNVCY